MKFKSFSSSNTLPNLMMLIFVNAIRVSFIFWVFIGFTTCQKVSKNDNFSEAIGFFAKEKSLAKSYAEIIVEFKKENIDYYGKGVLLYANAKAEYDGLIEQLKANLIRDEELGGSPDFQAKLKKAAETRVAFTSFVSDKFIRDDPQRKNPLILAAIATVPELIDALNKVGKSIWQEYRNVSRERKQEIINLLNTNKWKQFHEISKAVIG